MSIEITKEVEFETDFELESVVTQVINECTDYEKCPYETKVMVTFTDNKTIQEINREHRNIDRATDVLSFPMLEYEKPGDFSYIEENEDILFDCFDPDSGELVLGDIVISVDRAIEQAEQYGHSLKREIAFLVAHSMFHLFGYDHMEDEERKIMEQRQKDVLDKLKIVR